MRAASQLPGKGPTDVDDAPTPARYSKSDHDDDDKLIVRTFQRKNSPNLASNS